MSTTTTSPTDQPSAQTGSRRVLRVAAIVVIALATLLVAVVATRGCSEP